MYRAQAITFGRLHTWTLSFYYDKAADVLTIRAPWRQEGVWVELPEQVRVYVDRQTGEGFAFEIGAFRPPVRKAGDRCYISDHIDMAIGLNAASPNGEAARVFLNWIATAEFASLYAAALPGFFPLSEHPVESGDPLVRAFLSWRRDCHSTIRFASRILSRGTPDLARATWDAAVAAISGAASAEEIGARLHEALAGWYAPHQ